MTRSKPQSCQGCQLCAHGTDFSQPEGRCSLRIAIFAEASGEAEARDQLPLRPYAPSGSVLERTLRRLGLSRDQFVLSNVVRCKPVSNLLEGMPYETPAIDHCRANSLALLQKYRPKVILALGNIAFRTLTGISGEKQSISHMRGYVFRALPEYCEAAGDPDLLVIPTYHPAFLRRGAIKLTGVFARDIQRAVNVRLGKDKSFILDSPLEAPNYEYDPVNNPAPWDATYEEAVARKESEESSRISSWLARHDLKYITHPTLQQADAFCREAKSLSDAWLALSPDMQKSSFSALSYDLETAESLSLDEDESDGYSETKIRLSQFSLAPKSGITFPWREDYIQATRWLLKLPLPKVGHNIYYFDNRVLSAVGERDFGSRSYFQPAGPLHDTLQMFHFWRSDEPAHLQYAASYVQFPFPWKHFKDTNEELYACVDVDAALRVYCMARRTMIARGVWEDPAPGRDAFGYVNMIESVRPVLQGMEETGIPINDTKRESLGAEFDATAKEILAELEVLFPNEARKVTPKEGYKTVPPAIRKLLKEGASEEEACARVFQDPPKRDPATGEVEKEGASYHFARRDFPREEIIEGSDGAPHLNTTWEPRWCRVYNFSPNSPPQLQSYIRVKGYKQPKNKEGKDTTSKKELLALGASHGDKFFGKVIEARELGKAKSTYIDGYKPRADGRVHTTFTFDTATGQLSARNPNTQNYPSRSRLAEAVKSMIEAPEGWELANWDFKSYHVVTLGFLAEDATYMRMARLDMHSFITAHFLKVPEADKLYYYPDEELMERLAYLRKDPKFSYVRNNQAKPSILGIGLGLMPPHLYEMNQEHFANVAEAKKFRAVIERLFPKVFSWQKRICEQADIEGKLVNRFGMIRWFYEVLRPNGKGGWAPGDQYNAAMAFPVQSEAHGELREKLKKLAAHGFDKKYGLCNTIHDSLMFCYPRELREEHVVEVHSVLNLPSTVLIHPQLAPRGLEVGVECSVGKSMTKKDREEVKLPELKSSVQNPSPSLAMVTQKS